MKKTINNYSNCSNFSNKNEDFIQERVVLTPMSNYTIYNNNFSNEITEKLTPIGHPNPIVGNKYNCHGWSLGYKFWINIKHIQNEEKLFQKAVIEGCLKALVDQNDIFSDEVNTYAKFVTKKLVKISLESFDLKEGDIVAYYNEKSNLTHTSRCRMNILNELVFTSKLGNGHVVEHYETTDISPIYGDIIDYYSFE